MNKRTFLRSHASNSLLSLALLALFALGCNSEFSIGETKLPPEDEIQSMVRRTLEDFASGVNRGDFTDFLKTTSKEFRNQFPEDEFRTAFKDFVDRSEDFVPIFNKAVTMDAAFSSPPAIVEKRGAKTLQTEGIFRSSPVDLDFKFDYIRQDGQWKLVRVEIFTKSN